MPDEGAQISHTVSIRQIYKYSTNIPCSNAKKSYGGTNSGNIMTKNASDTRQRHFREVPSGIEPL